MAIRASFMICLLGAIDSHYGDRPIIARPTHSAAVLKTPADRPVHCEVGHRPRIVKKFKPFPKDIFLTRDRSKIPFIPARCRERCSEGIMRGAWVEIIIIGTHTLRAPVPIDSSIDTHQI